MAHSNLGNVLGDLNRLPEAEAAYRQALALQPDYAIAYNDLGTVLYKLVRLYEAEAVCRQALVLRPDFAMAHDSLGNVLSELGRLPEAEVAYRQALEPCRADETQPWPDIAGYGALRGGLASVRIPSR
jgi:Flp pilus assembly protein TadD